MYEQDSFQKVKSCLFEESSSFFKPKKEMEDDGAFFCENLEFDDKPMFPDDIG